LYTATASQTTFSGTDTQNLTLSYSDSNFIDVHQNGVLLKVVDDYTATSGTSVVLATGATASDVIEITVYDVFSIANHIKKTGDAMAGALTNIDIDGTELVLDSDGDTSITADTDDQIDIRIGGTDVATFTNSSSDFVITQAVQDKDIIFKGDDGGSGITALTLDMSDAGHATFNNGITLSDGDLTVAAGHGISFASTSDDSGMTSELLDDYEEGTWTPALTGPSSVSYSDQTGTYTKIGRMVFLSFHMTISSAPTGNSNYRITIPFTPEGSSSRMYGGDIFMDTALVTSNYGHFLGVYNGGVNVYVYTSAGSARSGSGAWQTGTLSGHIFINT
jgi:hypothetical protein